jgi:hypothetical protein
LASAPNAIAAAATTLNTPPASVAPLIQSNGSMTHPSG